MFQAIYVVIFILCGAQADSVCKLVNTFADCSNRNLDAIPRNLPDNITVLNLSGNVIVDIGEKNLSRYKNLVELKLERNKLKILRNESFLGLTALKILFLSENQLEPSTFKDEAFAHLKSLEELYLHKNLHEASALKIFCMKRFCKYADKAFSVLENLTKLSIDMCEYSEFGAGFLQLTNLKTIIFDYCLACELKNKTFENFRNSNITELHLSQCEQYKPTSSIDTGILNPFPNLKKLDLSSSYFGLKNALKLLHSFRNKKMDLINFHNVGSFARITPDYPFKVTMTKEMMQHLKTICVKTLILSDNGIVDAEPESILTYDHPECFEVIIFSANSFALEFNKLYIEALKLAHDLKNIKLFDYSYVPINFLHKQFILPPKLKIPKRKADISWNFRNELCDVKGNLTFTLPGRLESLRLSHVMTESKVQHLIIKGTKNLKYFDISYFQMANFPDVYMPEGFDLKYLDMSGIDARLYADKTMIMQNVETIIIRDANLDKTFRKGKNVFWYIRNNTKTLDISNNHLDILPLNFRPMSKLTNLNLSFNSFRIFPEQLFEAANLETIDLRFNNLFTINRETRNWLDYLVQRKKTFSLLLRGNLFTCTCENKNFVSWLFTSKVSFDNDRNYSCHLKNGTLSTTSKVFAEFHDLYSDCDAIAWLHIGVICIASSFVLIAVSALIYQYRWRMTYYFYRKLKKKYLNYYQQTDFEYDVFIAYAFDSERWLIETLIPKLERDWQMRVCLKDRDFLVGQNRAETIISGIQRSRRVLFIISPCFEKRKWGRFEIEMAQYEMFVSKRRETKIIVIMKDDTRRDEVPVEIGLIWDNITMIKWPPDEICTENAWNELKFQLK